MTLLSPTQRRAFEFLVLAPVLAALLICALLLAGVPPHLVFLPGHALKAAGAALGWHVANAVGVVATVVAWTLVLMGLRLAFRRRRKTG